MSAAIDIVTPRLRLGRFRIRDADALFGIRGDREAMMHWDWPADENVEQTRAIAASMLADMEGSRAIFWAVRLAADASFAGVCDLSELDASGSADLGFMFARRHWGLGLASEAVNAILIEAPRLGIREVRARVHADNVRSCRLLDGLGFEKRAVLPGCEIRPGVPKTCLTFSRGLNAA
jgi:RimJ/RimL family protein N-acetyltransferase